MLFESAVLAAFADEGPLSNLVSALSRALVLPLRPPLTRARRHTIFLIELKTHGGLLWTVEVSSLPHIAPLRTARART